MFGTKVNASSFLKTTILLVIHVADEEIKDELNLKL